MSDLGPRREVRIGDREREVAVDALGEHYVAGRLSREEYDERAEAAWQARTGTALAPLFADLPHPVPAGPTRSDDLAAARAEPARHPSAAGASWRIGVRMVPLLVLAVVLSSVVHAPVFLLLVVWLLWARPHRHPGTRSRHGTRDSWPGRRPR